MVHGIRTTTLTTISVIRQARIRRMTCGAGTAPGAATVSRRSRSRRSSVVIARICSSVMLTFAWSHTLTTAAVVRHPCPMGRGGPRTFDPVLVGNRETDAWAAYYRHEWRRFLVAAVGMVSAGFGM